MVIPLRKEFAVSLIKSGNGVSLHLIHTFRTDNGLEPLDSKDFEITSPEIRGTWLEEKDEAFPFDNPFKTKDALKTFEYLIAAYKWADRKIAEKYK